MALPETDLHRIRLWARERVPEHLWDELKVEADVSHRHVKLHAYKRKRPTKNVQALLDHIETGGDPTFWGQRAAH